MNRRTKGFTIIELLIVVAIIGILAAIAIPNIVIAIQRSRQKKTMTTIRNIATAWEARASDMSKYNAAGIFGVDVSVPITDVEVILSPTYIRSMPTNDAWGHSLKTYLDRGLADSAIADHYVIASLGKDGLYNAAQGQGAFADFDCDIIYSNGTFLTWPSPN